MLGVLGCRLSIPNLYINKETSDVGIIHSCRGRKAKALLSTLYSTPPYSTPLLATFPGAGEILSSLKFGAQILAGGQRRASTRLGPRRDAALRRGGDGERGPGAQEVGPRRRQGELRPVHLCFGDAARPSNATAALECVPRGRAPGDSTLSVDGHHAAQGRQRWR